MRMLRRGYLKTTLGALAGSAAAGLVRGNSFAPGATLVYEFGKKFSLNPRDPVPADEVRVLGGYLRNYVLPQGAMPPEGGWTAVFDLLDVSLPAKKGAGELVMFNSLLGQVAVSRRAGATDYQIQQHFRPAGPLDELAARIRCSGDDLRSIQDYELLWKSSGVMTYARNEAGTVQSGGLHISSGSRTDFFAINNPLATLWTLMDAVRLLPASAGWSRRFAMYMDLSSLRRDQVLRFVRTGNVQTADGIVPVRFYEQTGGGIQPIHYAVDEMQRTLFVTQGLLGWGLNRIERI
jgi:hypothetical protein